MAGSVSHPKKQKRLFVQIAVRIVPLILLMLILVCTVVYRSTLNGYLKAQNGLMDERLTFAVNNTFDLIDGELDPADVWIYDYWEAHPEVLKTPMTREEEDAANNYNEYMNWWDVKVLENMPDIMQRYCAKNHAQSISFYIDRAVDLLDDSSTNSNTNKAYGIILLDVAEPNRGFILGWSSADEPEYSQGDTLDMPLSRHPALKSLLENPSDRIEYEKVYNFPDDDGSYYIAYKPLFYEGKIRAVMGIFTSWKEFSKAMGGILFNSFLIGVGGLVVLLLVLLGVLYGKAVAPVHKIQQAIHAYMLTKNSNAVTGTLESITERNEIGILSENLSEMVQDMDRYTAENIKMVEDREKTRTELYLAAQIQAAILPLDFPEHPAFSLCASMNPAREIGGDFYDFFFLDEDHLTLVIADVSGKGIPAALFMMMCKNMIKNYSKEDHTPAEILEITNNSILESNRTTMFVTVWLGIYEISTGHIIAANAGHEYPIIRDPQGRFRLYKDEHGLVAGGIECITYTDYEFDLGVGSTLFLYTDGVPEATDKEENLFGIGRMLEALNKEPDASPETLIHNMTDAISDFVGDAPQFDDTTILVIQRKS